MQKELLLPAGSMEALKSAIHNGADAVYLGGKRFGARAFASNFDESELEFATKYCHLYGVKIYVTVNTLIFERELDNVLEYVDFLYHIHVDAIIVSDLGVVSLIHEKYPDFELHLSTQAHTFSENQMYFWKELGITRVVLDRELTIDEIEILPDILDIEVFIHGALCVSYSGQCYMSFMNLCRSGNRGSCAQLCRMPYELYYNGELVSTDGKYLLSTKELNTSNYIKNLMNSKIKSFKIEGRMKSPEYVGFIAHYYRTLIDDCDSDIIKKEEKKLKYLFNREFTEGYLFNNSNIMNFKTSNHQGHVIGQVIDYSKEKITIKLTEDLTQEDGIRFEESEKGMIVNFLYNKKGLLIHEATCGDIIMLDNKIGIVKKDTVRKTIDKKLMISLGNVKEKKIAIKMEATLSIPSFSLSVTDGVRTVTVMKDIVLESIKTSMTEEDIKKQLLKLGNTPFLCKEIKILISNKIFVPVSKLNEVRREAIEKLMQERMDGKND